MKSDALKIQSEQPGGPLTDLERSEFYLASQMLSYGALKLFPFWDPLRGDPRFEKIVASLAPKQ